MCILCRKRFAQKDLIRLQCKNGELINFSGSGRSFYLCKDCIKDKKLSKKVSYFCKISKEIAEKQIELLLKEFT